MVDFDRREYSANGSDYVITTANITGQEAVVAVTDKENDIHYISEEVDAASEDLLPTETVPSGYGMPDKIEDGVLVSTMETVSSRIRAFDKKGLEQSLSSLGKSVLGPDSNRQESSGDSSRMAERKSRILDHQASPQDYLD